MATDTGGNQAVDFVWGNMPMQPDTFRGGSPLNEALGDHIVATSGYNGFPDYLPVAPYLDTVENVEVLDVLGDLAAAAEASIEATGLVWALGTPANNAAGATALNDGTVKSTSPAAGTIVNSGTTVTGVVYAYTA